jgi:hypothetical protein
MNSREGMHRPGGAIESFNLYDTKMGEDGRQLGTKDLRGVWHDFNDGETIEFIQVEGMKDRVAVIQTKDGEKIPFETWAANKENEG